MTKPELLILVEATLEFTFQPIDADYAYDIEGYFADPDKFPDSYRQVMTWQQEMVRDGHGGRAFVDRQGRLVGINCYDCELDPARIQQMLQLNLPDLLALNLNHTGLTQFTFTDQQPKLTYVNLSQNESLTRLRFATSPQQLAVLDLYDSRVEALDLPADLQHLSKVDAARNGLKRISFAQACPKLWFVDISDNQLTELHLAAGFEALQYLFLRGNQLADFSFAGTLPRLETLDLRKNQLREIPDNFFTLQSLTHLFVHENPLQNIPQEAIPESSRANAWESIRSVLRSRAEDGAIQNDEVKLIILGNSTAGKSSLLKYLVKGTFDKQEPSTHGIKNVIWQPEGMSFKVNAWDFGGQEFYHATHRLFLSNNAVSLVVFEESTNKPGKKPTKITLYEDQQLVSKEVDLEHFHYTYWLKGIRHFAQTIPPICVVENKMDLKHNQPPVLIKDQDKQAFQIAEDQTFFVSVKGTAEQVPDYQPFFAGFEHKLKEVLEQTRATYKMSPKWIEIKKKLRTAAKERMFMKYAAYEAFCEGIRPGISKKASDEQGAMLDTLTRYLHEIGVILYYQEAEALRDYVFINPELVIDSIYQVLDYAVMRNEGRFTRTHVEQVVQGMKARMQPTDEKPPVLQADTLLSLMMKFELVFETEQESGTYVAPQYLPDHIEPSKEFQTLVEDCVFDAFTLKLTDFLPKSVMPRFICRKGHLSKNTYWKHGILFRHNGGGASGSTWVFVECKADATIHVTMDRQNPALTMELFAVFLDMINEQTGLHFSIDGESFVNWTTLKQTASYSPKVPTDNGLLLNISLFHHLLSQVGAAFPARETLNSPNTMTELQQLIQSGEPIKIKKAFEILEQKLEASDQQTLLLVRARWNRNERGKDQGTIDSRDYNLEFNRIVHVLTNLAEGIDVPFSPSSRGVSLSSSSSPRIYFSYSWKDDHPEDGGTQQLVHQLLSSLKEEGFPVVRDKEDAPYGGSINEFMQNLGAASLVVVFTSPRYFKSSYCMYELCEIGRNSKWENGSFRNRILPIMIEEVNFNDPDTLPIYIDYWEQQENKWKTFFSKYDSGKYKSQNEKYRIIRDISGYLGDLGAWLNDINSSSIELLSENNFALIKDTIRQRLN